MQQDTNQQQPNGRASPTNRSVASELGFDDAATTATIQSLLSTVADQSVRMQEQSEQMQVLLDGHESFKKNFEVAVELRMQDQHNRHVAVVAEMEQRHELSERAHRDELLAREGQLQDELRKMIQHFNNRDQAQQEAKIAAEEQQRLRDAEINKERREERMAYKEKVDDTFSMFFELKQMMAASALATVATQHIPHPMIASTPPRRPTTTQQSPPSRINIDREMEDASQLTNTLSGTQVQDGTPTSEITGVFSPPRIEKMGQASDRQASFSTEETHESTQASTAPHGTSKKQLSIPGLSGLVTQLDHEESEYKAGDTKTAPMEVQDPQGQEPVLFSGAAPYAGALEKFSVESNEMDTEARAHQEQGLNPVTEYLPVYPGAAPDAEALAKFSVKAAIGLDVHQDSQALALPNGTDNRREAQGQTDQALRNLSGTAQMAEALANFYSEPEDNHQVPPQSKEPNEPRDSASDRQGQDLEGILNLPGTAPIAEALAKFYSEPQSLSQSQLQGDNASESKANQQSTVYDNDDPKLSVDRASEHLNPEGSKIHQEDRQLESIWEKAIDSASDKRQVARSSIGDSEIAVSILERQEGDESGAEQSRELVEWKLDSGTSEEEGQESGREKRQRPLAKSPWTHEIKKAIASNSLAIVQVNTEPRQGIESPDRKRRAALLKKTNHPSHQQRWTS
jgi:hypothetical protein